MLSCRAPGVGILLATVFLATCNDVASAQPRRVKAKGEVVSVAGNLITLVDDGKNRLTVRPKAETPLIEISGPWKLDEIKPEMIVRLSGMLKSNVLLEETTELTLHSPADGYQLGIQQDSPDQPATIVGQFVRIKDGQLTIAVGRRRISGKLAEDAAATVESKDLRFVKAGDAIEIDAYTTKVGALSGRTIKVTIQPAKAVSDKQPSKDAKKPATKRKSSSSSEETKANQDPTN
jgi:hypothetical protein